MCTSSPCEFAVQRGVSVDVATCRRRGGGHAHSALYPEGLIRAALPGRRVHRRVPLQLADLAWDEAAQEYVSHYEATVEGQESTAWGTRSW